MTETRAEHTLEEHRTVLVDRRVRATPTQVFDAWLDPAALRAATLALPEGELVHVEIDATVGGAFSFAVRGESTTFAHTGEYLAIDRPQHLSFTWRVPRISLETSVVTIDVEPAGDQTHVSVKHEGVLAELEAKTAEGWTAVLDSIAARLEHPSGSL